MGLIDIILNLVALLIWLNWRGSRFISPIAPTPLTLLSTLRSAGSARERSGLWLAGLIGLLLGRSIFYWYIGSAAGWTAQINLGVVTLSFRSDLPGRMLLYSVFMFVVVLFAFHVWLVLLSSVNRSLPDTDSMQRLVRLHLGWLTRLPVAAQLATPLLGGAVLWMLASFLLARVEIMPAPASTLHVVEQSLVMGLRACLVWEPLIIGLLLLYMVNSYVYLGQHPFWEFIEQTGKNLLHPLKSLPLRAGKVDFAPILGAVAVFVLARGVDLGLTHLYQRLPL
ncbi:MAG: hypothetical protein AB1705_21955 [Verrucomicrobiota bacterium]